jgi:hypothetical protein
VSKTNCPSSNHKEHVRTTLETNSDYILSQSATHDDERNHEQEDESNLKANKFSSGDEAVGYIIMTQLIHTLAATIPCNVIALDTSPTSRTQLKRTC